MSVADGRSSWNTGMARGARHTISWMVAATATSGGKPSPESRQGVRVRVCVCAGACARARADGRFSSRMLKATRSTIVWMVVRIVSSGGRRSSNEGKARRA
eukprot:scaffold4475_cov114-Isochrysis_galbana.AAC.14